MKDSVAGGRCRRAAALCRNTVKSLRTEGVSCTLRKIYRFLTSWSAASRADDPAWLRLCRGTAALGCKTVKSLRAEGMSCTLRKICRSLRAKAAQRLDAGLKNVACACCGIRRFGASREKIAVFSPIPPTSSGVAYYTYRIHRAMPEVFDIITDENSLAGFRAFIRVFFENVIWYGCFKKHLPEYKAKIFLFGNSPHYDFVWDEAVRTRGEPGRYLYAHEALLHRAFLHRLTTAGPEGLKRYLEKYYPEKADIVKDLLKMDWNLFCVHGVYGARVLVEETGIDTIFVNNDFCREMIYRDLTEAQKKRVKFETFFLPVDEPRKIRPVKGCVPPSVHLIGTFGSWSYLKMHEEIVAAVNKLNAEGLPVKLLVGTRSVTAEMCRRQGVDTDNCLFVNTPDDEYFLRLEKSVELAVLLRKGLHGNNCSGCLSQAWGMKVPVIANKGFPLPEFEPYCHLLPAEPTVDEIAKGIRDALEHPPRVMSAEVLESLSFRSAAKAIGDRIGALESGRVPYSSRIYVDATLFDGHGIQRAMDSLYLELRKLRPEIEVVYVMSAKKPADTASPCRRVYIPGDDRKLELLELLKKDRPEVAHFPWNGSFDERFAELRPFTRIVSTVHDIIPAMIPDSFGWGRREVDAFLDGIKQCADLSDWVFFDSENSLKDLAAKTGWGGENGSVLYFAPMLPAPPERSRFPHDAYFLYNGGYTPRKCLDLLVKNYLTARREGRISSDLVLTGHIRHFSPEFARNVRFGTAKGWIRELGFVSDEELSDLLAHAAALYYPSLYEGFGIPPLEAMSIGCPVVTTRRSSIPEICGDGAYYIDPSEEDSFIESFCRLESDARLRESLRRKGREISRKFSWDSSVREFAGRLDSFNEQKIH